MNAVVACGGTGGHAFPGLAVAAELVSRGHDVTVWDSGRDVESSVMRNWNGKAFSTGARQFRVRNVLANLRSLARCRRELKLRRPDVMLAMGSYSSFAPVLSAAWCGVPVVLHEANAIPGRAVEFLSRFAKSVATSFDVKPAGLSSVRTVRTGLPVRGGIASGKRLESIPPNAFTIFVTGGSQGAHMVNLLASEAIVELKRTLDARGGGRPLYVIHQTGEKDEGMVMAAYAVAALPARVNAFEDRMADAFASADIVIARAGASTCFELAACGKPALLIPLPSALRNHQHLNAEAFAKCGAADEASQNDLTPRNLTRYLLHKYDNPQKLAEMAEKMKAMATPDAASHLADLVEAEAARTASARAMPGIASV